ncbi:MAG: hypothetical protein MMC23_002542 [Stictis urceolatum]|nr:hypothetical protein [Stictis urceolata]
MSSAATKEYWGYLIKPDKSPAPLFEELLLGIAHYIKKHIAPWEVHALTPAKMAAFYRLVGGNYDSLFLESPDPSIAFIYKSLGCFHSLEPDKDPFASPSVPALTSKGFVRWQTVQLLLEPEEHVPFLQEAVKRLELRNPADGETFPRHLPAEALPKRPDPGMCQWEEGVREKLRAEAEPMPTPRTAKHASRPSDVESLTTDSSTDDRSIVDAADYFQPAPHRIHHPNASGGVPVSPGPRAHFANLNIGSSPQTTSHSQERGRSHVARDDATPTHRHPYTRPAPPTSHSSQRGRLPSLSTDDSFVTSTKSRSPSPPRHHHRHASHSQSPGRYARAPVRPTYDSHGRRHSAHDRYPARGAEPNVQPSQKRNTLSPHFFAPPHGTRPTSQPGPLPPAAYVSGGPIPPGQVPLDQVPPNHIPPNQVSPNHIPPNQIPPNQIPPNQAHPIPIPNGQPLPGAFARGPTRATIGHGYRGPSGDWRGQQQWMEQRNRRGAPPPVAVNGNGNGNGHGNCDAAGVRFVDEEVSPRGEPQMRRRTVEEMAKEREGLEMEFEMGRRRERRGSGAGKGRGNRDRDRGKDKDRERWL